MSEKFLLSPFAVLCVLTVTLILIGCPEGQEMVDDIITEPADMPPTNRVGEMTEEVTTADTEAPVTIAEMKKPKETPGESMEPEAPEDTPAASVPIAWKQKYENDNWAVMKPFEILDKPSVRLIYFLPRDRPLRSERALALCQMITETQKFFADEMERHGFGRKSFTLETDANGVPVVHFMQGRFKEEFYHRKWSLAKIADEFILEHAEAKDLHHIYFIVVDLSYESFIKGQSCGMGQVISDQKTPRAAHNPGGPGPGGFAIIPASGHCFYDERGYLHPLRVATHELAHAFGLMHDFSEDNHQSGPNSMSAIGGRGFFFSHCDTEWLSASRFFNAGPFPDNSPGTISILSAPKQTPEGVQFRFQAEDADGLYQAQLLVPEAARWGDERIFACQKITGESSIIEFVHPALLKENFDEVILQIIDKNGGITLKAFSVSVR